MKGVGIFFAWEPYLSRDETYLGTSRGKAKVCYNLGIEIAI